MTTSTSKTGWSILLLFSLVTASSATLAEDITLWANKHIDQLEEIVCLNELSGDYFFIAKSAKTIKAGYLIDVSGKSKRPQAYEFSWKFLDSHGNFLEKNTPIGAITSGYRNIEGKIYSESIGYRHLVLDNTNELHVSIAFRKYEVGDSGRSKLKKIDLCVVPLNQND